MAGVAKDPFGPVPRRAHRIAALAAVALLLCLLLLLARSASPGGVSAAKAAQGCSQPYGLAPAGPASQRFTMMIRINTQGNVDTYTKPQGGMGGRIRPQDIFVLNTRFAGTGQFPAMTPAVAAHLAADLHSTFPCNRIIALNGMSLAPDTPGWAFTGIDDPDIYALLTDYEQSDWNSGRATDPA